MFKKDASPGAPEHDKVATFIGQGTEIKGDIKAKGSIRIDGHVDGEIDHEGDLVIGEEGVVEATIKTRSVTIAGEARGNIEASGRVNIEASGRVEIVSTGRLYGDITVNALIIHEGAVFDGNCQMRQGEGGDARRRALRDKTKTGLSTAGAEAGDKKE